MPIIAAAPRNSWQARAVEATGGNTSRLGCLVLAILGWQHGRKPPRFGSTAVILKDGTVMSNFQNKAGNMFANQAICTVQEMVDSFRGLADHLKLNDIDRLAMFEELRKWIREDKRAEPAPLK